MQRRSTQGGRPYKRWHKKYLRSRHHQVFLREIKEQLALRAAETELPRYVQEIVGFVETDLGRGSRRARSAVATARLPRPSRRFFGAGPFHRRDALVTLSTSSSPGCSNCAPWSSVTSIREIWFTATTPLMGDYFAVIDGVGDKNIVPLSSISARLNRLSKLRRIARMNNKNRRAASETSLRHVRRSTLPKSQNH